MRHCLESYLNELVWWGEVINQDIFETIKWYWLLEI
jgi:hypothetical protein